MLRLSFGAWDVAFSEAADGDLRVSARSESAEPLEQVQLRILGALGVGGAVVGRQVHGAEVLTVAQPLAGYSVGSAEADGVATTVPGVAAAVHVADCVPVAVGGAGAVAMLHCGWRGLDGGIISAGVSRLRRLGVEGQLAAAIGPGVGGCCYETGEEVRERFSAYGASAGRLLDLKAVARAQLHEEGVELVEDVGVCTICSTPGRLYSHRRDGASCGRQGGFAWLRS
jgi:YfiH family protein